MSFFGKKNPKTTIDDCREFFKRNPEYRYLVVCGKERSPLSICKDMESAEDEEKTHFMSCGELPIEIIDLLYGG